jgi:hypothetical protein
MSRKNQPLPATPDLGPARVFDKRRFSFQANVVSWEQLPLVVAIPIGAPPSKCQKLLLRLSLERWLLATAEFVPFLTLRVYLSAETYSKTRRLIMDIFQRFSPRLEIWVLPHATTAQVEAVARTQAIFDRSVSCACIRRLLKPPSRKDLEDIQRFIASNFKLAVLCGTSTFMYPMVKGQPHFLTPWNAERLPDDDDALLKTILHSNPELVHGVMSTM